MDKLGKILQRDLVNASPSRFLMDDVKENEMASSLPQNVTADYVRAIGSDGKSYRIPKADFASIIRSELGTILNGLSDQQTVTKVPTLNGNTLGASAIATLASVLGGALLSRRTRLTDFDLAVLKQAVADQNLEKYGLKVGDQKTINGRTYVIAGLNPMKGTSTPYRLTQNHVGLIVIPHVTQKWNESGNTYTGADGRGAGYANSDLHYYLTNTLLPLVQSDLGSANLLAHSKLLSNAVDQTGTNKMGSATGLQTNIYLH